MKIFLSTIVLLYSGIIFAGVKVIGNGGDVRALEFFQSATEAIKEIKKSPAMYPEVAGINLDKILENTDILVSEVPVFAVKDGINQVSTAINYHNPDTIVIYGPRWTSIKNSSIRGSLALHEILGLANLEKTGEYGISKRYLKQKGITCSKGLCEDLPRYECGLSKMTSPENITRTVAIGTIGNNGGNNEIVNIESQSIKATIVMNAGVADGHIMLLLYQDGNTVAINELRGTSFPPFIMLQWKDTVQYTKWTLTCQQN